MKLKMLILILLLSIAEAICAEETIPRSEIFVPEQIRSISIACPKVSPPFFFMNENGEMSGIGADIWHLWSEKTGICIRFMPGEWKESLDMIRDSRADVHAGIVYTRERDRWLNYVGLIAHTDVNFFFHKNMFGLKSLEDLRGFKIGVISASYSEKYVREHLPGAVLSSYPTVPDLLDAAEKGEILVFVRSVENTLWALKERGLLGAFRFHADRPLYRRPFFAAVREEDTELCRVISEGMNLITSDERAMTERKWLGTSRSRTKDTLIIALPNDFPPFTFLNAEGKPAGMYVDMWRLWAEKTGRKVEFRALSWKETLEALRNGDADIHSGLFHTESRTKWIAYSQPFYEIGMGVYFPVKGEKRSDPDMLPGQKTGCIIRSYEEEYLRKHWPNTEIVTFQSVEEMIHAARDGHIRAFLDEPLSTWAVLARLGLSGEFDTLNEVLYTRKLHAGVLKGNKELLDLVDKGLDTMSNKELAGIESRWIGDSDKQYYKTHEKNIRLTAAEEAWLDKHRTIRLGADPGFPPFSYQGEEKVYDGIFADYVRMISERIGISVQPVFLKPHEILSKANAREVDIFCTGETFENKSGMNLTPLFFHVFCDYHSE